MASETTPKARASRNKRVANPPVAVTEVVPYIDTIHLLLPEEPPTKLIRSLREKCGSVYTGSTKHQGSCLRIHLNQPPHKALCAIAKQYPSKRLLVSELHLALDLCTQTQKDANRLGRWLNQRLVHRWHRLPGPARWVRGTRYTLTGKVGSSGFVVYSDDVSKLTDSACCHVEWRGKGSRKLSDRKLNTLDAVIRLDHRQFWMRELILERINKQAILRQTTRHIQKTTSLDNQGVCKRVRRAIGQLLRASIEDPEGEALITAHAFRCVSRTAPWIDMRYAVERLDTRLLLPAPSYM